ncbi:concanavalin A-like lectin/glucanase domain-containing protein [Sparassis latifolia]
MYLKFPLMLFLLLQAAPSDANLFSRGSETIVRSVNHVHRHALRRSAGLAKDIRRALSGILVEQQPVSSSSYCGLGLGLSNNSIGSDSGYAPAASAKPSATSTGSAASPSGSAAASSPWKLTQNYQGSSFFNGWTFFTAADPTNGNVQYVDSVTAQSANLTEINSAGNAVMRVETTPTVAGNRKSVRITTNYTYTGALVVMDSVHMPTGCGTWPAFWSNGPNWPAGGEIDIVEGVNSFTVNQATIHTNPNCNLPTSNSTLLGISGTVVGGTNCAAAQSGNAGCGIRSSQTNSYGAGFNAIGGGVYTMQWNNDGISVWFFPRSSIPSDITAGAPQPTQWGQSLAFWPATDCNPQTFFYDHSAIFDTTLCGEWAGNVWGDTGVLGQEQSCQQMTSTATCAQYVQNNGAAFADAYWEVKSVKIYQYSS